MSIIQRSQSLYDGILLGPTPNAPSFFQGAPPARLARAGLASDGGQAKCLESATYPGNNECTGISEEVREWPH